MRRFLVTTFDPEFGGLAVSFYFDLPASPATVALLSASVPAAAFVSQQRRE
jgi:hypothetical protein